MIQQPQYQNTICMFTTKNVLSTATWKDWSYSSPTKSRKSADILSIHL